MSNAGPMLQNAPFSLLAGGLYQCDPTWDKPADGIDQCYKLYLPIRGQARLTLETQDIVLRPGQVYLIPGYHLVRQQCQRRMDVYWIHFVPESLPLAFLLSHVRQVHAWQGDTVAYWRNTCKAIPALFEHRAGDTFYRVQAMLMDLVSQTLKADGLELAGTVDPAFEQLRPAVAYMNQHWRENPRLAAIAKSVHLAPNYFHRKFVDTFHITPCDYMLNRRLNVARQLLLTTNLTLARIAEQCGFSSAFHLSKIFKKRCGVSPKQFRRQPLP